MARDTIPEFLSFSALLLDQKDRGFLYFRHQGRGNRVALCACGQRESSPDEEVCGSYSFPPSYVCPFLILLNEIEIKQLS